MKKKLESELISIAHRVLKLKNRSETIQLQEETKKLYDKLTVLRFYEDNIAVVENEISLANLEAKLENTTIEIAVAEIQTEVFIEEEVKEAIVQDSTTKSSNEEMLILSHEDAIKPQSVLFEDIFGTDFTEPDFVKVNDVPVEVLQATNLVLDKTTNFVEETTKIETNALATEIKTETKDKITTESNVETIFEEPKTKSLNDKLTKGINIGLNDRIAFEKKLFNESPDDFNRVLSQLNTFDSFEEVKGFIDDFVKPDYNNWEGKEEYENRFLEIVEKKFN